VRHPGYASFVLAVVSMPIVLGSFLGFIPSVLAVLLIIIRTGLEDKTLIKELPGYFEYTNKVKGRLIPGVW